MDNNTDKTLNVVFSRIRGFSFTITQWQKPKRVTRMLSLCLVIQHVMQVTPLGYCLRVVVNEKHLNLEKTTTSSVLSVFLAIYDFHTIKSLTRKSLQIPRGNCSVSF